MCDTGVCLEGIGFDKPQLTIILVGLFHKYYPIIIGNIASALANYTTTSMARLVYSHNAVLV